MVPSENVPTHLSNFFNTYMCVLTIGVVVMETVVEETSLHLCGAFVQSTNQNPADHNQTEEGTTV